MTGLQGQWSFVSMDLVGLWVVMESGPANCGGFDRQLDPNDIANLLIGLIGSAKWVRQRR